MHENLSIEFEDFMCKLETYRPYKTRKIYIRMEGKEDQKSAMKPGTVNSYNCLRILVALWICQKGSEERAICCRLRLSD